MTPAAASASVRVGGYSLDVGTPAGSFVQFEPEQETENAQELRAALAEKPRERHRAVAAVEELQESAAAVTDRIQQADDLLRAAADGRLLDPGNLTGETDALLDLLGRLDRAGRFEEELALARSLNGLLVVARRWLDLVRSLRSLLEAAQVAGNQAGQALAHHELGSLHLCAGEPDRASRHLREALRIEEQLGDMGAGCATRHNLDSARRDLSLPGGGRPPPRRLLRLAGLVAALVVAGAGGAGIALAIRGGGGNNSVTQPEAHAVTVARAGSGTGSVTGGGIACPGECTTTIGDGRTVTLAARATAGSVFGGWAGVDCGDRETCTLTVTEDVTATATFERATDTEPPSTPTGLRATAVSAGEIDLSWVQSSDNVAVAGYVVYRDGAELTTVSGATTVFQDTTVAPSTGYVYSVQAVDAAGNVSERSSRTKATTPAR